ncbi:MAG: hypothetical protein ABL967_16510 [Bryobacteraceae bacterium]
MNEKELKKEISQIFQKAESADQAMATAGALLGREFGEVRLLQGRPAKSSFREPAVMEFLESREYPFRGVYMAAAKTATVILLLRTWGNPQPSMQIFADHVAEQLSSAGARFAAESHRSEAA